MIPKDYNSRLTPIEDKGLCGDPEIFDSSDELTRKLLRLVALIKASSYPIVFTGAGISTSSGIPDFRGPNGVWTRELKASEVMEGTFVGSDDLGLNTFNGAKPSFTHRAIACLTHLGIVKHVVSQNVDGLHLRSGVLEDNLSELHGNIFKEKCEQCGKEYLRDFDVGGMGLKRTGRRCGDVIGCNGSLLPNSKGSNACEGLLRDCAVDWDTELPTRVFERAHLEHDKADLVICIGTSLRIRPAGNMPLRVLRSNSNRPSDRTGHIVIINLQKTHLDKKCSLKINFYCDEVMHQLCDRLGISIHPPSDGRTGQDAGTNSNVDAITSDSYSVQKGSVIESILSPTGSRDSDYRAIGRSGAFDTQLLRRSTRTGGSSHIINSKDFKGINKCSSTAANVIMQQATSMNRLPSKTARRKRAASALVDEPSMQWNKGTRRVD